MFASINTPDEPEPSGISLPNYLPLVVLILFISCRDGQESKPAVPTKKSLKHVNVVALPKKDTIVAVAKHTSPSKKKKKIYLTFDDGPNKGTRNVLDIVQQEQVPVTFFIVGEHVFASPAQNKVWDSLKTAQNIELCNHSYTHAHNKYDHFYTQPGTVVRDMEMTKEKLLPENSIVRAPGRNSWRIDSIHFTDIKKSKPAMDSLQKAGFVVMGWDLEWHYDPKTLQVTSTADQLMNQVDSLFRKGKTRLPDNLVILAHDQVYHSQADSLQLREFIRKLKSRDDFELSLVSSYPAIKKPLVPVADTLKPIVSRPGDTVVTRKSDTL